MGLGENLLSSAILLRSLEWERNVRNRKCHCGGAWDFFAERERQGNKRTERRGEIEREENGKLKEAESNNAAFKGNRFLGTVIQSMLWLKFNEHTKGARSL